MAGRINRHIVAHWIWGGWKEKLTGDVSICHGRVRCCMTDEAGRQAPLVPGRERDGRSPKGSVAGSRCWWRGEGAEDVVSLVI